MSNKTLAQRVSQLESLRAVDPNLTANVETDAPNVPPANPTSGPHRITFVVPNPDESVLSVGQACSTRINDPGITGRTKTHVHLHTTDKDTKTMLALGVGTHEGWKGHDANNLAVNKGFMVVTEANTWIDAQSQLYLISRDHDTTIRAAGDHKRVMIQADKGEVDVVAHKKIQESAPIIALMAPATVEPNLKVNYTNPWTGDVAKASSGKITKYVMTIVGAIFSAHDLGRAAKKTYKKSKKADTTAKKVEVFEDVAKWVADAAKFAITAQKIWKGPDAPTEPGTVKLGADMDISGLAGRDISLFGVRDFSAGGAVWAGVSAGVGASFKATLFAGVGGMYTSLKGYRKVEMASDYGKAILKASKVAQVISEESDVEINADADVGVTATNGAVYSAAKTKMHLVVDGGTGILCEPTKLFLGMLTGASKAKEAKPDSNSGMSMTPDDITCYKGQSGFALRNNKVTLLTNGRAGELIIDGSQIKVEGSRICLG